MMADTVHVGWGCDDLAKRIEELQSEVSEMEATISTKRAKLVKLQEIQRDLLEEFGPIIKVPLDEPLSSMRILMTPPATPTRKEQIARYLLANGPKKRSEIIEHTKIPSGTVAFEMRDARVFKGQARGPWDVTDAIRARYQANPNAPMNLPISRRQKESADIPEQGNLEAAS